MNIEYCYNQFMEFDPLGFQNWIQEKFAEWRGKRRESLADFARFLGVSPQVMSNWWNGSLKERPDPKQYNLLILKFGDEAFNVLGIPKPHNSTFDSLVTDFKEVMAEIKSIKENNGTENASPEELEKINNMLSNLVGKYQEIDGFLEKKDE